MIQAEKKIDGVNAALAASFDVLKIPMPITSPMTIIVSGNKPSLFFSVIGVEDRKKTLGLVPHKTASLPANHLKNQESG